ncbi:MAG: alcohol dehydrogenase catalytic domain-containing protein, partial [Pseudomonadota bacterium]
MKAAVLESFDAPLVMHRLPSPEPTGRGAVIRVHANGICRSDWHAWKGHWPGLFPLPHVLGHEMAGVVEEVGSEVMRFRQGDRVIVPFIGGDGGCHWCQLGLPNLCNHPVMPGFKSWGAYGEYVAVDHADHNLIALPESITYKAAAGMGCRYMTAFHAVIERARAAAGEWLVVYGCGGVGLSVIEIAASIGAAVIAVDINAEKLDVAKRLGAVAT